MRTASEVMRIWSEDNLCVDKNIDNKIFMLLNCCEDL